MAVVVSINGINNLRNAAQIHLLPSHWQILCLDTLDDDLDLNAKLAAGSWWWESSAAEFVAVIFKAVIRRHSRTADAGSSHCLAVLQCGAKMYEAVALAMIAIKENHEDLTVAKATFDMIISKMGLTIPKEHHTILIKNHSEFDGAVETDTPQDGKSSSMGRDYDRYQAMLRQALAMQELAGQYDLICVESDNRHSQRQTQDIIRNYLSSSKILPDLLKPTLERIKTVYAIAGLSECGKSTVADMIHKACGTSGARLKMSYFLDEASNELGYDIYSLSGERRAAALLQGLDAFGRTHWYLSTLTIESVHRYDSIASLKSYLGSLLQIIYIETNEELRLERSGRPKHRLEQKDAVKRERGGERVKEIADIVLDNNELRESLEDGLRLLLRRRERSLDC